MTASFSSKASPIGYIEAVTVTLPGTRVAVEETLIPLIKKVTLSLVLPVERSAFQIMFEVLFAVVIVVRLTDGWPLVEAPTARVNVTPAGRPLKVKRKAPSLTKPSAPGN
jgi:hypothetical protein